ncbi:putative membrane protein, partial [Vibrio harveyi]
LGYRTVQSACRFGGHFL